MYITIKNLTDKLRDSSFKCVIGYWLMILGRKFQENLTIGGTEMFKIIGIIRFMNLVHLTQNMV